MSESEKETNSERPARLAVLAAALAAWVFVAGIYAAPLVEGDHRGAASLVRAAYGPLCHQLPGRSLTLGGRPQAVCARCVGLYLGGAAGLLAAGWLGMGSWRPRARHLLLVLLPTFADAAAPLAGLAGLESAARMWVAFPAGFLAALFLAEGIADLVRGGAIHFSAAQRTLEDLDG